ncbi:MAG: autotransporter outer membrane beta-barrel domain-containing protein, partial [Rhodospirillales bacterium]|nr:autotransporter outer membrane beta-barrel domain-containing protein [Rhodospirillales bacterium]
SQDGRDGAAGYSASSYGVIMGADGQPAEAVRVGLAFAYAHSIIDSSSAAAPQGSRVNSYLLIGYGSYKLDPATTINVQADIGRHDTDGHRDILFANSVASSSYASVSGHVGVGLSHGFAFGERTRLIPSVRLDYTTVHTDSYGETGAGALNLNVQGNTAQELISGVDAKVTHALNDRLMVTANLGGGYDVLNERASITSAFAGDPGSAFVTRGLKASPWLARGGVGLVGRTGNGVELTARYDVELRDGFSNQTASVRMRLPF